MIKLYARADCPFCWKVKIALAELALPFDLVATRLGEKHPEVVALSPRQSVPVLVDDALVIWESAVILEYLHDAYGDQRASLLPQAPAARARARLIHSYSDQVIGPALRDTVFEKRTKPPEDWDQELLAQSAARWRACLVQLETWLDGGDAFAGDFSLAECALAPRFGLAQAYGVGVDDDFPGLARWFATIQARPSYQATLPRSFPGL